MIEKQVPGIKFDTDRKEQKTNVIHNKIPNCQNKNWYKTEKITFLQGVTCNKTHTAFFWKTTWVLVCNSLLLVTKASNHNSTRDYVYSHQSSWLYNYQKINRDCQKLLLFNHWFQYWTMYLRIKYKHNNKIFKKLFTYFLSSFKGYSNKKKKNFYE